MPTPRRGRGPHSAPKAPDEHRITVVLTPEQWRELHNMTTPPPGFYRLDAVFSEAEWMALRKKAVFEPDGTIAEAIRTSMGLKPHPRGLIVATRAEEDAENRRKLDG